MPPRGTGSFNRTAAARTCSFISRRREGGPQRPARGAKVAFEIVANRGKESADNLRVSRYLSVAVDDHGWLGWAQPPPSAVEPITARRKEPREWRQSQTPPIPIEQNRDPADVVLDRKIKVFAAGAEGQQAKPVAFLQVVIPKLTPSAPREQP
jgi:hypothetical protein